MWTQATPRVAAGTRDVGFPKARKGSPACGPSRREARPCPKPKEVTHATFHAPPSRAVRVVVRACSLLWSPAPVVTHALSHVGFCGGPARRPARPPTSSTGAPTPQRGATGRPDATVSRAVREEYRSQLAPLVSRARVYMEASWLVSCRARVSWVRYLYSVRAVTGEAVHAVVLRGEHVWTPSARSAGASHAEGPEGTGRPQTGPRQPTTPANRKE